MSQRHHMDLTSNNELFEGNCNIFLQTIAKSGVLLSENENPNYISKEQALVVRDIEKYVDNFTDKQSDLFLKELQNFCKDEDNFRRALSPCFLKASNEGTSNIQQDSLIRLILRVNKVQNGVIDFILDEITSISSEDNSTLGLLLNSLRYLPYIKEGESLTIKLLDILEISSFAVQLEIIDSIPYIIPDNQYSTTARQLSRLLDDNNDLSAAIIDCLNSLNLDTDIRMEIQDRILAKLLIGTSLKLFPVYLDFLLGDRKNVQLIDILFKIRNALDNVIRKESIPNDENESSKILIFNKLQNYAEISKIVYDSFISMLGNIKSAADHKPVDFLLVLMLHNAVKFKKRQTETFAKKKIQNGLFRTACLKKLFENIPQQLLKDYTLSIIEFGCNLLKNSNEQEVLDFISTLLILFFNHNATETIYRQELLDNLIHLLGDNNKQTSAIVLSIFSQLLDDLPKLQRHTLIIMRLLEKLDSLHLKQVKEAFNILCALTCSEKAEDSMSGLRDEIHMIVRKQLSSAKRLIKQRGIIAAVVMAKHIATTSELQSDISLSEDSVISLQSLPAGRARDAATLLELTSTCIGGCPEFMGLFYDQLASMIVTGDSLDKYFMAWLYETVTNDFQSIYVTETVIGKFNDLEFSMQYLLNSQDEMDTPLGINIAELTVKNGSIKLLAPHFRLLRLLHYRQQDGDLSSIDALLGCAVILPKVEDLSDLGFDQLRIVSDCLYHCSNWFREVISGFVTQKSKKLRAKVVQRVTDLIEIEKLLNIALEMIPEHKLPSSNFECLTQNTSKTISGAQGGNARKKFKPNTTENETLANSTIPTTSKAGAAKKNCLVIPQVKFRDIDIDLIVLLKYPLNIDNSNQFSTQTASLTIDQLNFILQDFVEKLSVLTQNKDVGLSHLNSVNINNLMNDCAVLIFPNLNKHLRALIIEIAKLLGETDGRHDLPQMFTEDALKTKKAFGLIIQILYLIFSWSGFEQTQNLDILKQILKSSRNEQSQSLHSANRLIVEFINNLANYHEYCLNLDMAVNLIKTMDVLYSYTTPSPEVRKKIISTCGKLLGQRWYNIKGQLDTGKNANLNIGVLIKIYLDGASIKTICGIVGTLQEQVGLLKSKEDSLHMLASIDKSNLHIFYFHLCNSLANRIKIELQSKTNAEHLIIWRTTALTMQGLMAIAKIQESKVNLVCFLKKSISILKVFLSLGIPIMELMLRKKPDDVVAIFKAIQTNTRFLHHLCCYSKLNKDKSILSHVPNFRLILETLVQKVKAVLVANNCSAAFWMGNLRNRDLQGEDILSQTSSISNSEIEDDDAVNDLPLDDDSDDGNADIAAGNQSESEVYD